MSEQFNPVREPSDSFDEDLSLEYLDPINLPQIEASDRTVSIRLPQLFVYYAEPIQTAN